jgi:3-ketosteroid 9alpha-monooxygenase subunit B
VPPAVHELRIARIVRETEDARSFVLEVPEELREVFRYRAGQFLTFQVPWGETTLGRCYSLSSAPESGEAHQVTVKRVDEGRVSNWFNDALSVGDRIRVLPPAGRFVLSPGSERDLVLFGAGSGITPVFSILKSALAATTRRIKLLYANRNRAAIIFRDEIDALAARHPERLAVVHHLDEERGFVAGDTVRREIRGLEAGEFYLCGPGPFMDRVEEALGSLGVERARIRIERFASPADGELPSETEVGGPGAGEPCEAVTVHLEGEVREVPYAPGDSLLETARRAGLAPPFACEEGYCGCCMARLVRGRVAMAHCHALDADEVAEGWILTCQARPLTRECEIRWE